MLAENRLSALIAEDPTPDSVLLSVRLSVCTAGPGLHVFGR